MRNSSPTFILIISSLFLCTVLFAKESKTTVNPNNSDSYEYILNTDPDPCDENWQVFGGICGLNSQSYALLEINGDIYAGGTFRNAGGTRDVNYVGRWDGSQWHPVGNPGNNVRAMVNVGDTIYAGGDFGVRKWDGLNWNNVGNGISGRVWSLHIDAEGNLYAGGDFTNAGGSTINRIAKWDGSSWSSLGTGVNNSVFSISSIDTTLFISGPFTEVDGQSLQYLAQWNGASWDSVGSVLNGWAKSMVSVGDSLYIGGTFSMSGDSSISNLVVWDGISLHDVGGGTDAFVEALYYKDDILYVGGYFSMSGDSSNANIASWNGSHWIQMNEGVNHTVRGLHHDGTQLYMVGDFLEAGGQKANRIASWDGTNYHGGFCDSNLLNNGLNDRIYDLALWNGDIYAVGDFTNAGGVDSTRRIARWDGLQWSSVGGGTNELIRTIHADANGIYIGGDFTEVGNGISANRIAHWDGTNWNALGIGSYHSVYSITRFQDSIYASGLWSGPGGLSNVAKWDGSNWIEISSGVIGDVYSFASKGDTLYVGGGLSSIDSVPIAFLGMWDGTNWSEVGGGTDNAIQKVLYHDGLLYIGGLFTDAGGSPVNRIATWDGTTWQTLGSGVSSVVNDMQWSNDKLYATGSFNQAGGQFSNYIAKWDGTNWQSVCGGIDGSTSSILVNGVDVYIGGGHGTTDGKISQGLSIWKDASCSAYGDIIITEVMIEPTQVLDTMGHWIELYNTSTDTINLNGYTLTGNGTDCHVFDTDVWMAPGSYITIGNSGDSLNNGGVNHAYVYDQLQLLPNYEIIISCPLSGTVDSLNIDSLFDMVSGATLSLSNCKLDATENDNYKNWFASISSYGAGDLGSPDQPNEEGFPVAICKSDTFYFDSNGDILITPEDIDGGSYHHCVSEDSLSFSLLYQNNADSVITLNCSSTNIDSIGLIVGYQAYADTCYTTIFILDTILPSITCRDTSFLINPNDSITFLSSDLITSITDNCNVLIDTLVHTYTVDSIGQNHILHKVFDAASSTAQCTSIVNVSLANQPPVAVCDTITVPVDSFCLGHITAQELASSSFDPDGDTLYYFMNTIGPFDPYIEIFTNIQVTDLQDTANCVARVYFYDASVPDFTCGDTSVTLLADGTYNFTNTGFLVKSYSDNCGSEPDSLILSQYNFDTSHIGSNIIIGTVYDNRGNSDTCAINISILAYIPPNQPPVAVCDTSYTYVDTSCFSIIDSEELAPLSFDPDGDTLAFDHQTIYSHLPKSPLTFGEYPTWVFVSDGSVTDSCLTQLIVQDTIPPELSCVDTTVLLSNGGIVEIYSSSLLVNVEDNCFAFTDTVLYQYDSTHINSIQSITHVISDASGNTSNCISNVSINLPNRSPIAICDTLNTVTADTSCMANISVESIAGSSIDPDGDTLTYFIYPEGPYSLGNHNINVIVSDGELFDTCFSNLLVEDKGAGIITCPVTDTLFLDSLNQSVLNPRDIPITYFDYCSGTIPDSIWVTQSIFNCSDIGSTTIIVTTSDPSGNQSSCLTDIIVIGEDRDGDGTPDCQDECPDNPDFIMEGLCGCTTNEVDTDNDGTVDCDDACPNDPNKVDPGQCGCSFVDIDSDGDGTADCLDFCPTDSLKIFSGECGCGVADMDSDGDGFLDCNDGCPTDSLKIAPGINGCGVSDPTPPDTDNDGTPDSEDECPFNANKILAGVCGCDVSEIHSVDSDGDGLGDCLDGCPNDGAKLTAGACGCGQPDIDTDGDGAANCIDECPTDSLKVLRGICGCGTPDVDTDGDGIFDCDDLCPTDPGKISPGTTGCGNIDPEPLDTDKDGVIDSLDLCPLDSLKVAPGICGCGKTENPSDIDGDGVRDCIDGCPSNPLKSSHDGRGCFNPCSDFNVFLDQTINAHTYEISSTWIEVGTGVMEDELFLQAGDFMEFDAGFFVDPEAELLASLGPCVGGISMNAMRVANHSLKSKATIIEKNRIYHWDHLQRTYVELPLLKSGKYNIKFENLQTGVWGYLLYDEVLQVGTLEFQLRNNAGDEGPIRLTVERNDTIIYTVFNQIKK